MNGHQKDVDYEEPGQALADGRTESRGIREIHLHR
jgi:hypothetical protein